jgi:hypothetical protein
MDLWFFPTSSVLVNTFLRSIVVVLIMVFGFKSSWYSAYWAAIIQDVISLVLIKHLV